MLHQFLTKNRAELIDLCRTKVDGRRAPKAYDPVFEFGIPQFLDQLIGTLEAEQTSELTRSRKISAPPDAVPASEMSSTAARHGGELLQHGFAVEQVVRE